MAQGGYRQGCSLSLVVVLAKLAALLVHLGIPWEGLQQKTKHTAFTHLWASGAHTDKAVLLLCNFRCLALQGYFLLSNTLFVPPLASWIPTLLKKMVPLVD